MPYVVQNKYHSRIREDGAIERFEVGDRIEPTDSELAAFPDKFRKLDEPRRGRPPGVSSTGAPSPLIEDKDDAS